MIVVIMSGIPGSGKSTKAKQILGNLSGLIVSADDYFVSKTGEYRFDPKKIHEAHQQCLRRFCDELEKVKVKGAPTSHMLIVDNTNLRAWEIATYYCLTESLGIPLTIFQMICDPIKAANRCIHNVPLNKVMSMYRTQLREEFPPHWKIEVCEG